MEQLVPTYLVMVVTLCQISNDFEREHLSDRQTLIREILTLHSQKKDVTRK